MINFVHPEGGYIFTIMTDLFEQITKGMEQTTMLKVQLWLFIFLHNCTGVIHDKPTYSINFEYQQFILIEIIFDSTMKAILLLNFLWLVLVLATSPEGKMIWKTLTLSQLITAKSSFLVWSVIVCRKLFTLAAKMISYWNWTANFSSG